MKIILTLCATLIVAGAMPFAYTKFATAQVKETKSTEENTMADKKSIVIYFSRADENYGIGYVTKGNTQYLAEFIAEATGADMFKIEPAVPYAKDYETAIEEAKEMIHNEHDEEMKSFFVNVVNTHYDKLVRNIEIPVILIWGNDDEKVPLKKACELNKKLKNSELYIMNGDHFAYIKNIEFTRLVIQKHLRRK